MSITGNVYIENFKFIDNNVKNGFLTKTSVNKDGKHWLSYSFVYEGINFDLWIKPFSNVSEASAAFVVSREKIVELKSEDVRAMTQRMSNQFDCTVSLSSPNIAAEFIYRKGRKIDITPNYVEHTNKLLADYEKNFQQAAFNYYVNQ